MRARTIAAWVSLFAFLGGLAGAVYWAWAMYRTPSLREETLGGVPVMLVLLGVAALLGALSAGAAGSLIDKATGHVDAKGSIVWMLILLAAFLVPPVGFVAGIASALPPLLGFLPWKDWRKLGAAGRRWIRVGAHGIPLGAGRLVFSLGVGALALLAFAPQSVDAWISGASWQHVKRGLGAPHEPFVGSTCWRDANCAGLGDGAFCDPRGVCSTSCEGTCAEPDPGHPPTFCIERADSPGEGRCVAQPDRATNPNCEDVPGTEAQPRERFVGDSDAEPRTARVCLPAEAAR
ncbi:MAG: hypothetical protein ACOCXM_11090 [Myxococcota bacterium]